MHIKAVWSDLVSLFGIKCNVCNIICNIVFHVAEE